MIAIQEGNLPQIGRKSLQSNGNRQKQGVRE